MTWSIQRNGVLVWLLFPLDISFDHHLLQAWSITPYTIMAHKSCCPMFEYRCQSYFYFKQVWNWDVGSLFQTLYVYSVLRFALKVWIEVETKEANTNYIWVCHIKQQQNSFDLIELNRESVMSIPAVSCTKVVEQTEKNCSNSLSNQPPHYVDRFPVRLRWRWCWW